MIKHEKNIYQWFWKYVEKFLFENEIDQANIDMKITHSLQVYKQAEAIARSLSLAENEISTAKIIALLHDVGRFTQYKRYHSFADHKTLNHAKESIRIIKSEQLLQDIEATIQEVIFQAIAYHNYPILPEICDESIALHSKILRDADKCDIFRVVTEYYEAHSSENKTIGLDLPHNDKISQEIVAQFMAEKIIYSKELSNLNDFKILQLAWIYDLNYSYSIAYVKKSKYLQRILQTMPANSSTKKIAVKIDEFLRKSTF
jgi:putative nucleotidyltransferase with HDIG domain